MRQPSRLRFWIWNHFTPLSEHPVIVMWGIVLPLLLLALLVLAALGVAVGGPSDASPWSQF